MMTSTRFIGLPRYPLLPRSTPWRIPCMVMALKYRLQGRMNQRGRAPWRSVQHAVGTTQRLLHAHIVEHPHSDVSPLVSTI